MHSLVTGGKGFIGSNLVKTLLNLGHKVSVIDHKKEIDNDIFTAAYYYGEDLKNFEKILPLFDNVDNVFHLAADVSIDYCINFPKQSSDNNSISTLNALECCRLKNIKKFIFSSTSAVYKEKMGSHIYKETDETYPLNTYSASKLYGESLCRIYSQLYGLETTILRYFNVYGNNKSSSPYDSVIKMFLKYQKYDLPLQIFGDGKQTRDFIHVDDVVNMNIKAYETQQISYGEIFNVGTGKETTVNKVARLLSNNISYSDAKIGELKFSRADNKKAVKSFGWKPKIGFEDWITSNIRLL